MASKHRRDIAIISNSMNVKVPSFIDRAIKKEEHNNELITQILRRSNELSSRESTIAIKSKLNTVRNKNEDFKPTNTNGNRLGTTMPG